MQLLGLKQEQGCTAPPEWTLEGGSTPSSTSLGPEWEERTDVRTRGEIRTSLCKDLKFQLRREDRSRNQPPPGWAE